MPEPPQTPRQLAAELAISVTSLRRWLRATFPRSEEDRGRDWNLTHEHAARAREHFGIADGRRAGRASTRRSGRRGRDQSDEWYVIDLCDGLLGERARRQETFSWLVGDPGRDGHARSLPVDAYYRRHALVVEYAERQHEQPNRLFDRRATVSGVDRGTQRAIYDQRRLDEVPRHGLRLVIVRADDLDCDNRGRLRRNVEHDGRVLLRLLADVLASEASRRLDGWVSRPPKQQITMLTDLAGLYRANRVLPAGRARSLHACCPDRRPCWAQARGRESTGARLHGDGEDNSIFWPFVGRRYRPGGVAIVGWNLNHDGNEWFGMPQEFVNADHDRDLFEHGRKKNEWNSAFGYRSLAAGLAVDDARRRVPATADPEPIALATGMQRLARLQAVKCAPRGENSNPTDAMNARCPQRYLLRELRILRPSVVLAFGEQALVAVGEGLEFAHADRWVDWQRKWRDGSGYARGTIALEDGWNLTILGVYHPTYGGCREATQRMIRNLRRRPLP